MIGVYQARANQFYSCFVAGYHSAPGTISKPGTSAANDAIDSVSSPLAGPSRKTVSSPKLPTFSVSSLSSLSISSPLSVSLVHQVSLVLGQFPRSPVP